MGAGGTALALVVLVVGAVMGWHASRAHAAHGDLRTTRKRLPGYRKSSSGLQAVVRGINHCDMLRADTSG